MKKYTYLFLTICCIAILTSCGKDDKTVIDEVWKQENEDAFNAIKYKPGYSTHQSGSNNGFIYYKELKKGTGNISPAYTDSVKVYYTGWFGTKTSETPFNEVEDPYSKPMQCKVIPLKVSRDGVIEGWSTALQKMHVGDRWEIWVPQELGYGSAGNWNEYTKTYDVLPYTTLKFEVELVEILRQ